MGRIDTFQSRTGIATGATADPIRQGSLDAEQRAVGQLADVAGGIATVLGQKAYRAEGDAQALEGIAAVKGRMLTAADEADINPDVDSINFDAALKDADSIANDRTNKRGRQQVQDYITANKPIWDNNLRDIKTKKRQDNIDAISEQWPERIEELNLTDPKEKLLAEMEIANSAKARLEGGRYTPAEVEVWAANELEKLETVIRESAEENIKPVLIAAISESNKSEDGYKALDTITAQLVKDGILTETEAAETNKKLGDWIDSYVSGRIKAAKNADSIATIQTYQKFSKPILNGEMTYDDTGNFRETRRTGEKISDADRWREYIKGSYKEAPTQSSPEGHTVSFAAVYDVATLQLSPKEGYDVLLEARFIDQSITNEQFEWAVGKIENPYPRHVLEDVNATLKSNLEDFNRFFRFDEDRNRKVNEALISWIDVQESPPSKKEMFAMSSAFRAGGGQPHDIGGVIERGGQQWEIVGFDDDGEALVELIE